MKALTLHRPWAWAIAHADKRIENRKWHPPHALLGQRLAIHSGLKFDEAAAEWIRREIKIGVPPKASHPAGAVVAVARLIGVIDSTDDLGCVTLADGVAWEDLDDADESLWHCGPFGWVLDDVQTLGEPVPCRGAQGLWTVPPDVEARIADVLAGARSWQPTLFGALA